MSKIIIRPGNSADLPAVHNLVRELAIYEQEEAAFTASLADYERDFSDGVFQTLVAEKDDQVVGMCLYYMTYSTWKGKMLYLEDFVVGQASRNQGIGQLLFEAFLDRAQELDCRMVKWQVLDWNEAAVRFYERNQAIVEKTWWNCKIFLT
jgi:GNAT superfamily N-acetyltransferase